MDSRARKVAGLIAAAAALVALIGAGGSAPAAKRGGALPPIKHVFTIVLENKNYEDTFGAAPGSPYLGHGLTAKGQLLTQYHGTGHFSLGNYITMISGQSENPTTQADCQSFDELVPGTIGADGQALGAGCVYPVAVQTVADQLEEQGLTWRGYMEDMGDDLQRDTTRRCAHPPVGASDPTQHAEEGDQYATRHNPFVYFHSVIDDHAACKQHVVNLERLRHDLREAKTTRNFTFITPDLCSDGHDEHCVNPEQFGGYGGIDQFLSRWVPRILKSPAYKRDGLLIVTFDESESGAAACCFAPTGPNTPMQGIQGPGGGRVGTVLISKFIEPGSVNDQPYNHYDYLHTIEDLFGLGYLGYAARPEVRSFGADVFGG
jgi:hypothetical protein